MSTTDTISTSTLEGEADRAREEVARDVGALRRRSEHAARHAERLTLGSSRVLFGLVLARLGLAIIPRPRLFRRRRRIVPVAIAALCGVAAVAVIRALALGARRPRRFAAAPLEHEPSAGTASRPMTVESMP